MGSRSTVIPRISPLLIVGFSLVFLPFILIFLGLTVTSATEVVVFSIACMGLNILVGHTGLVSFGHGAWFGLAAYGAAIAQREFFPKSFLLPLGVGMGLVALLSFLFGILILRRRGTYFSLLTLALSAMLYVIAFRWTAFTGGENGLGGLTRPEFLGIQFEDAWSYYALVAILGFGVVYCLWRFHNSPIGTVLVAIRENEQRARFIGYASNRYKLLAFTLSATITGLAGVLLTFNNRLTSAEPISVAFSGELLAMVVIGGMRSFLGPALGALFFILLREFLSSLQVPIISDNWLLYLGLLFVGFIVFSPTGLVGVATKLLAPWRRSGIEAAAMANRRVEIPERLPESLRPGETSNRPVLVGTALSKRFGGLQAVKNMNLSVANCTLHALIGPNGAGKTTSFNLLSGLFPPDQGSVLLNGQSIIGLAPERICQAGIGRSFQITNLFPVLSVAENIRLAVQARNKKCMNPFVNALSIAEINTETAILIRYLGLAGIEEAEAGTLSYGGQRLLDMGLALATKPRILLLDEPLAGLAAAERQRIGDIIKRISADIPVLLVEHDIDRVFQISDAVTVMNEGEVLVDGSVEEARSSQKVQEIYIGSGVATIAAKRRESAAQAKTLLSVSEVNTFYGKSHILNNVSFALGANEILALLGRNGAGKSTLLKTLIGIAPPASGKVTLEGRAIEALSSAQIARLGVALVPQGRGLFAGMSVRQNLELGALKRRTGNGVHWELAQILDYFPRLRDRLDVPADYLSGGEQQMVAVARALSGDVRVLLLDEPFEGLAPAIVEQLFESFDRLRREIALIIVDHNLDLALAISDRTIALERGSVVHQGSSQALRDDLDLRRKVLWL